MKKIYFFFSYLGGPGGPLCWTQVNKIFRAVRPHHRADLCITRDKNNYQFFIYGAQYTKMCIFGYSGGPGWPINNRTGPILLPSYPLTYINIHIKYGSNPITGRNDVQQKYNKPKIWKINLFILGVLGALTSNPGLPKFRAARRHHRADKFIEMEKIKPAVFHTWAPMWFCLHFWLFRGGGEGRGLGGP